MKNPSIIANNDPPAASQNPIKSIGKSKYHGPKTYGNNPELTASKIGGTNAHANPKKANIIHSTFGLPNIEIIRSRPKNAIAAILNIKNTKS